MNNLLQGTSTQYGCIARIDKHVLFNIMTFIIDFWPFSLEEVEVGLQIFCLKISDESNENVLK
jgi:hypothetical protein